MQRIVIFSREQLTSRLPSLRLLSAGLSTGQMLSFRSVHNEAPDAKGLTAAAIKKNVPELWVRKMKTFFAFYDRNNDGVVDNEDYKDFIKKCQSNAASENVSKERIEEFSRKFYKLWIEEVVGGNEKFEWTESKYIEDMFEAVSRPGSEEFFRNAGKILFQLFDLNGDGHISKEEIKTMLGGYPFSIVSFAGMDINRNGEVSEDEFVQTYIDFWFNFADDTNPSKNFFGPLVGI